MSTIDIVGIDCFGCLCCEAVCPVDAISQYKDEEGFIYPRIDKHKCVECGKCTKVCACLGDASRNACISSYAAKVTDAKSIKNSSSGGISYAILERAIEKGWVVYACVFDDNLKCKHARISLISDLALTRGSKYVQSELSGIYAALKDDLNRGQAVVFVGTPCQVAAIRKYCSDADYLLTIDIVCHGVPSQALFEAFLRDISKRNGARVEEVMFRDKDKGWNTIGSLVLSRGRSSKKQYFSPHDEIYYRAFIDGMIYRESCYKCQYSTTKRPGDITLGDFWGVKDMHPEIDSKNGVSLVMCNSPRGVDFFASLEGVAKVESSLDRISASNPNLNHPTNRPLQRNLLAKEMLANYNEVQIAFLKDKRRLIKKWTMFIRKSIAVVARKIAPSLVRKIRIQRKI